MSLVLDSKETTITINRKCYIESINSKVRAYELMADRFLNFLRDAPGIAEENMREVIEQCNRIGTINQTYNDYICHKGLLLEFNQYATKKLKL